VLLYKAFGWELPKFWHMPLLRNTDKSKISKRKNPVSLHYYRDSGFLPQTMLNFLGLMGGGMAPLSDAELAAVGLTTKEADLFTLDDMRARFDFSRISLGGPVFDLVKLRWMNGEYLRRLSPEDFFLAMRRTVFSDDYLRAIAPLVQTRLETLGGFGDLTDFFFKDNVMPPESVWLPKKRTPEETLAFAAEQLAVLEATAWDVASIEAAMKLLGEAKGWSVKENFMLLRAILTGSAQSPPLMESLVVFGKARSLDRVRR
jgi:glutamyl-tRNA synthetase